MAEMDSIPDAKLRPAAEAAGRRWRTRLWWLTAICVLVAIGVTVSSLRAPGEKIVIHFRDGHGIKPNDTLRYRGIDIGAVTEVQLARDMQGIDVRVQLSPEHDGVAVEGSKFWIERPRLRLGQVSGLETVIGAKYIGMVPGAPDGPQQLEFTGLESPLGMAEQDSFDIRIQLPAGEGLATGDPVRFRGIDVGEVTYVELGEKLDSVRVGVRLVGSARKLARVGTQFWIERPRIEVSEIRGLDTLLGGRYLALEPAREAAPLAEEFIGLAEAPPLQRREGCLEIELEARSRLGLMRGAPITYRGLEVGRVADVGLASDGASVTVQLIIEPEYSELVRKNSVWWATGGVRLDAGLTGFNISVDSFSSWLRGGVSFATPEPPGDKVVTGYRFGLAEKAEPEWLDWQPRIATGSWTANGEARIALPRVTRMAASWQTNLLGFTRRHSAQAWCLPLDNGNALLPYSLISAAQAANGPVNLEIAGSSRELDLAKIANRNGIASVPLPKDVKVVRWPAEKIADKPWNGKSALIVVNPELSDPLPLDASRASGSKDGSIEINEAVPIHKSLEGSAVIDTEGGMLLGLLVNLDGRWYVAAARTSQ